MDLRASTYKIKQQRNDYYFQHLLASSLGYWIACHFDCIVGDGEKGIAMFTGEVALGERDAMVMRRRRTTAFHKQARNEIFDLGIKTDAADSRCCR